METSSNTILTQYNIIRPMHCVVVVSLCYGDFVVLCYTESPYKSVYLAAILTNPPGQLFLCRQQTFK